MDRATSLVRRNLAFVAAACVFLAAIVLRPSQSSTVRSTESLPLAFPGFEPGKARAIEVERKTKKDGKETKERVRLVASSPDLWAIETSHGYPAATPRVKAFLDSVRGVHAKSEPTENPEKFAQFGGDDGFTEVRILAEGEVPLASFGIGKSGAGGAWSDVYLRIDAAGAPGLAKGVGADPKSPGKGRIVVATGFETSGNRTEVSSWVETRVFPSLSAADVLGIDLEQPAKSRTISLVRGKKGEKDAEDPWDMTKPEASKAVANNVMGLVRAFVGANLGDIVDSATGPEADAKYGFDKPDVIATAHGRAPKEELEGPSWRLKVGKKAEGKETDRWYVRRGANGKEDPFVFTVSDWELRDFRGEPAQWQEKKPEPPAEPAMGEPAMAEPAMGETPPGMGATPAAPPAPSPPPAPAPAMGGAPPAPPAPPAMEPVPPPAPPTPPAMGTGGK